MDFHMQSPLGPRVVIGGRERDYFSGTGYLGLQNHPLTVQAAVDAIQRYGMATGTSRGGYGDHDIYDALEAEARRFFDADQALYQFCALKTTRLSGWMKGRVQKQCSNKTETFEL